jgi:hypothetical protein
MSQTPIRLEILPDGRVQATRTDTDAQICTPFSTEDIALAWLDANGLKCVDHDRQTTQSSIEGEYL